MIDFPNGKINLGLHVTQKRKDGFHNLESVFYPVNIIDVLEIITTPGSGQISFETEGLKIEGKNEENLIFKAIRLFGQKKFDYKVFLKKNIPMGGGLGGGSSDATFTLKILKNLNALKPNINLFEAAMELGSDCGFFTENKPCLVSGRGENIEPVNLNLDGYFIKLVFPKINVSTKIAFGNITPNNRPIDFARIMKEPLNNWQKFLVNDFETGVVNEFPALKNIKNDLLIHGAQYAAMSGSGSTFYGIYNSDKVFEKATEFEELNISL